MIWVALAAAALCIVIGLVVGCALGRRAAAAARAPGPRPKRLTRAGREWAGAMSAYMARATAQPRAK